MKTGGLKRIYIVIIGVVLGLLMAIGCYFALIQPDDTTMQSVQQEIEGFNDTISKKPSYESQLKQAQVAEETKKAALAVYEKKYMRLGPDLQFLSMKDPQKAMILLWKEQAQTMGPTIQKFLKKSGVTLLTPIQIPGAVSDPNQINPNEYDIPLGQVQVMGTFAQINKFIRSLKDSPRLLRVNSVELAGESPNITATMDLTIVILPRDSTDFKAVPLATDTSGGGGTASPGMPGAMPGGPGVGPYGPGGGNGGGGNGGGGNGGK